jgi:hypothetical protein
MKISILLCTHRYGGADMIFAGLEHQTFNKNEWELIWCDKLYNERKTFVNTWSEEHNITVKHFEPQDQSPYHIHSSVLNECLEKSEGKYSIVIGDYSYVVPNWIEIHHTYNEAGYCLCAPQKIYALPRLCNNLEQPLSVFKEDFTPDMFKLLPQFMMDPKLQLLNGALIDFHYWYNRNESFPTEIGKKIGGWDKQYNNRVGPSNLEFGLRIQYEGKQKIACDGRAAIYRILSYPIPPHVEFLAEEIDDSINQSRYKQLCKKYNVEK